MHLILFFNGWGMTKKIIDNLISDDDLDVHCINYPYNVNSIDFSKYNKIFVIGWSFGVYHASQFLLKNKNLDCISIAINGVPYIIGEYGISLKMFQLTLNNLSLENLKKFYLNMGLSLDYFEETSNLKILKEELEFILNNPTTAHYSFDYVYLGKLDRIIPYSKQLKFYKKEFSKIITLQCEHYPFKNFKNWREIIDIEDEL